MTIAPLDFLIIIAYLLGILFVGYIYAVKKKAFDWNQ